MSWLVNTNLSSLKNQLSSLAKEVLADVEETVREVTQDESKVQNIGGDVSNSWSQIDLVTAEEPDLAARPSNDGDFEEERKVLLRRIQELSAKLQKTTSDASSQSTRLQRQIEELEVQLKILQGDKDNAVQRARALEKYESEAANLRLRLKSIEESYDDIHSQFDRLQAHLQTVQEDADQKGIEIARLEEAHSRLDEEIVLLKRVNEDLETMRLAESRKVCEEREAAEKRFNAVVNELTSLRLSQSNKIDSPTTLDYDDLFDKVSFQIQSEASESAVCFVRKLEGFLKDISSSGSSSKSSIDALEDGLAQLAAYEEFDLVKSPKDCTTQTEVSTTTASSSPTPTTSGSTSTQTDIAGFVNVTFDHKASSGDTRSVDSQTPEQKTVCMDSQTDEDQRPTKTSMEACFTQTEQVTVSVDCQTDEDLRQTVPSVDTSFPQNESDSPDLLGVLLSASPLTELSNMSSQTSIIDNIDISTSCDIIGVDSTCQTEIQQDTHANQTEGATTSDQSTTYDAFVSNSDSQTDTVDVSEPRTAIRLFRSSFTDTPYAPVVLKLESELGGLVSADRTLALLLDLIVVTYKQLSEDLAAKLSLQNQVGKLQGERNQLIHALQQKHQESLSYHSEVQKLSKSLQENVRKRQLVAEASVQFNGFSDIQEEVVQLKERETLLTAEAINLKQTVEQIRNRHNSELLSLKEKLRDTEEKLHNSLSNENIEEKCTLLTKRLNSLQQALDAIHKEKETEIQEATQRLRKQLESADREKQYLHEEITALKEKIRDLDNRLGETQELNSQLSKYRGTISSLQVQLERNEKHRNDLQFEIKRLKDASSNHVDRYLVANLVCGYVSAPGNDKQKVLNLLSTVLDFTSEEKTKCGLIEQQAVDQKALSTAFLQFLEAESKARPKLPPLAHYP